MEVPTGRPRACFMDSSSCVSGPSLGGAGVRLAVACFMPYILEVSGLDLEPPLAFVT